MHTHCCHAFSMQNGEKKVAAASTLSCQVWFWSDKSIFHCIFAHNSGVQVNIGTSNQVVKEDDN